MNIAREVIDYIVSQTSHVVGTDIFQAKLTSTNNTGVVISSSGGAENDTLMQQYIVNIACQYNDYDTANDVIVAIFNLLSYSNGLTLASAAVHNSVPMKFPGFVTVTNDNKYIFSCSIVFHITRP
jgi:hypothetical protein